jgi:hypothetical protein
MIANELNLVISTGNDDLRSGSTCDVVFTFSDHSTLRFPNINQSQAWAGWTISTVPITGLNGHTAGDIQSITLETAFGGGFDGDNWNVERVQLLATVAAPTFESFSPNAGPPPGGQTVTVSGSNFVGPLTQILFGSTPATNVVCSSSTQCTATIPPGNGAENVTVVVGGVPAQVANGQQYRYSPSITSVTPSTAHVGDTVTIGQVGLAGATISFGTAPATNVVCNDTTCTVTVPPGAGTVDVTATSGGYTSTITPADRFTYAAPVIGWLNKTHGGVTGGTFVTIAGEGFDPCPQSQNGATTMQVFFGSTPATKVLCDSSSQLVAWSPPAAAPGTVEVTVSYDGLTSASDNEVTFTYTQYPGLSALAYIWTSYSNYIEDIVLDSAAPPGGALVTLTGNGYATPTTVLIPAGSTGINLTGVGTTLTASYQGTSLTTILPDDPYSSCGSKPHICMKGSSWDPVDCICSREKY